MLTKDVKSILVINLGGIGDLLLSAPALRALESAYPKATISFLATQRSYEILKRWLYLDKIYVFYMHYAGRIPLIKLWRNCLLLYALRNQRFDLAVNMRPLSSRSSANKMKFLISLIGPKIKAGRDTRGRGDFYDIKVPDEIIDGKFDAEYDFDLVQALGARVSDKTIDFPIQEQDQEEIEKILSSLGVCKADILVGIHPGGRPSRRWPIEYFSQAIKLLSDKVNCKFVITGSHDEKHLADKLVKMSGVQAINLAGKLTIPGLGALINRCSLFISNDTATMHIAAILKVPLVAIFGSGDLPSFDPRNICDKTIVFYKRLACSPCTKYKCNSLKCLKIITPLEVANAALKLLEPDTSLGVRHFFAEKAEKVSDPGRYWGEYSAGFMDNLIARAKLIGWRAALKESFFTHDRAYYNYITDPKRANWHHLLNLKKDARILDLGCGWGTLSFSLAQAHNKIVAFDVTSQRLEFIRLRKESGQTHNLFPVCGQLSSLPFCGGYFDLVILNGVLEWAGVVENGLGPAEVQMRALREARRVLKPDGVLYLAIENRWSLINFLGCKDTHSGLRFAPLLPRRLANIYSRMMRNKDFREYTYTYGQLKKILTSAGFFRIDFYAALPTYRKFYFLVGLNSSRQVKFFLGYLMHARDTLQGCLVAAIKILRLYGLVKYFTPDYSIFAYKDELSGSSFGDRHFFSEKVSVPESRYILKNSEDKVMLFNFNRDDNLPRYLVKIYEKSQKKRLDGIVQLTQKINTHPSALLQNSLPGLLRLEEHGNYFLLYEEFLAAKSMERDAQKRTLFWETDFLGDLGLVSRWMAQLQMNFPGGQALTIKAEKIKAAFIKIKVFLPTDFLFITEEDVRLNTTVCHRDLRPANVLKCGSGKIKVVDWDLFQTAGLPLFDLLNFTIRYLHGHYKLQKKNIYLEPKIVVKYFQLFYLQKTRLAGAVKAAFNAYATALGLEEKQKNALLLLWLYRMFYVKDDDFFLNSGES